MRTVLRVSTESVASIVEGGGYRVPGPAGLPPAQEPAPAASSFMLYADRAQALRLPDRHRQPFSMYFPESLRGLSIGAPVDFRGIVIGEVKSLGVEYGKGFSRIRFPVEVDVYPDRLWSRSRDGGPAGPDSEAQSRTIIDQLVAHGMRGQLRAASSADRPALYRAGLLSRRKSRLRLTGRARPDRSDAGRWTGRDPGYGWPDREEDRPHSGRAAVRGTVPGADVARRHAERKPGADRPGGLPGRAAGDPHACRGGRRKTLKEANAVLTEGAPIEKNVQEALKQVAQSARALELLADYLERHPESLIRGKPEDPR